MEEIRIGDIGTIFRGTIYDEDGNAQDISTATTKQLIFKKPDGTLLPKTATFFTDGTDGKLQYTSVSGDFNVVGRWQIEPYVITPAGEWHGSIGEFYVRNYLTV